MAIQSKPLGLSHSYKIAQYVILKLYKKVKCVFCVSLYVQKNNYTKWRETINKSWRNKLESSMVSWIVLYVRSHVC